jgi:hypothetical protein
MAGVVILFGIIWAAVTIAVGSGGELPLGGHRKGRTRGTMPLTARPHAPLCRQTRDGSARFD